MGALNGRHSKEAQAIMGIWFGRYWTREDLLLFAKTLDAGIKARKDMTDDQRLIMSSTVKNIKAVTS